jgi:restriction system protein
MEESDQEVLALQDAYIARMLTVSTGAPDAKAIRNSIYGLDSICKSIANENDPINREFIIRSLQSSCLGAAERDNSKQELMEILSSYIKERVSLAQIKDNLSTAEKVAQTKTLSNHKTNEVLKPQNTTLLHEIYLEQENVAVRNLRESFLEKMMRVQRPTAYQKKEDIEDILISLDKTCDYICKINDIESREVALSIMRGAFKPLLEPGYDIHDFLVYLSAYIREGVVVRILNEPSFSETAPRIVIQSLIIPGDKSKEGILVKGVSSFWFEMMRHIRSNPDIIYHLDCWKWEEMLAGAYKQDGWEIVTLTPKKGDKGIDIIAERSGFGQLRFLLLDQMKAYKPDHVVGPDEIREMKGVMLDHPEASKGLITTTANFSQGALDAAKNLSPRLELRPKDKLVSWLASIIIDENEA